MALESMTGIGQEEIILKNYLAKIEIKSVNNRFKDYRFKIPSLFQSVEIELRKIIEKNFVRGSFDISINLKKNAQTNSDLSLDYEAINSFINHFKNNIAHNNQFVFNINPIDFLKSDFQKMEDDNDQETKILIIQTFEKAIKKLKESRVEEGHNLKNFIDNHLNLFQKEHQFVKDNATKFKEEISSKIKEKLQAYLAQIPIDQNRFHQELVYYLEKMDIDEEINRIASHLEKLRDILRKGGESGRKIDFLLQELNREVNTIGSKSSSENITNAVVNMKVQLEKIREQSLNIE